MKQLNHNLAREIKRNLARFLSIFAISALGVSFFAGIRAASPDMKEAGDRYFNAYSLADITVMSTSGLTDEDIEALRSLPGVEAVMPVVGADASMDAGGEAELNVHLISMPIKPSLPLGVGAQMLPTYSINREPERFLNMPEVISGRLPLDDYEVALDSLVADKGVQIGDWMVFAGAGGEVRLRVVGFIDSVKYVSRLERGNSTVGNGLSDAFAYASGNAIIKLGSKLPMMGMLNKRYTQAEILVEGARDVSSFSEKYDGLVDAAIERIEEYGLSASGTWYVYDRTGNAGYSDYSENTDRIAAIGDVFPLIFFVVAALVTLTTMTRMVEEKRTEMGALKALGFSGGVICFQYVAYAALASVTGGIIGCVFGFKLFPTVIGSAYNILYRIPGFKAPFRWDIAVASIIAIVACTVLATLAASLSTLREKPAALLRPKAPKAGKRIILERVTWLWKRLSFTAKVTVRNLIRYRKRFWMSVIGIAGSCSLLVTGFGLKDSIFGIAPAQFGEIWNMDVQGYAYDAMPMEELKGIVETQAPLFDSVLYCYDKPMTAAVGETNVSDVHLLGVESYEAMSGKIELIDGGDPVPLTGEGVVITRKLAEILSLGAGSELTLVSGGVEYPVMVTGVADNYVRHYVYMTPDYYERTFGMAMRYNGFMACAPGGITDEQLDEAAQRLLSDKRMYHIASLSGIYEDVENSLSVLDYVVLVLIAGSAMLTFVVMLNLTNINITERRRELATLRVLGFYDKETYDYVFRENIALAVIGAAAGMVFGRFMHSFVIKTCEVDLVMFIRSAEPISFVYAFALTVVFCLMVNAVMRRKIRAVDMVESLKSAE